MRSAEALLTGWGGGAGTRVRLVRPERVDAVRAALHACRADGGGAIARGMGRSYGDAAQLRDGVVLDLTSLKGHELDAEHGLLTAQAGSTLGELLDVVVPAGWMLPVVPGTQHVTIGGAVASDIHGKNHGVHGTFGSHVRELGLVRADGELVRLAPGDDLFRATIGGMGLTGVIVWVKVALRAVRSAWLSVDTDRVDTLDDALAALQAPGGPHRVAWLDLLGPRAGRGVVTRAEHASEPPPGRRAAATVRARATVPARWPGGLLRPHTVRAFNELRFRRMPRRSRGELEPIGRHMFPLDALDAWPRLYGRLGFLQYQLVVPYGAERVLERVIELLGRERVPCYLAVLKDLGPENDAPLSFPMAGWTLTLDIPRGLPGTPPLLERYDQLVVEAGGRVYLSKDSRLRPDMLAAMYPRLEQWRSLRGRADPEGMWRSDLALRTGLVGA